MGTWAGAAPGQEAVPPWPARRRCRTRKERCLLRRSVERPPAPALATGPSDYPWRTRQVRLCGCRSVPEFLQSRSLAEVRTRAWCRHLGDDDRRNMRHSQARSYSRRLCFALSYAAREVLQNAVQAARPDDGRSRSSRAPSSTGASHPSTSIFMRPGARSIKRTLTPEAAHYAIRPQEAAGPLGPLGVMAHDRTASAHAWASGFAGAGVL